MADKIASFEQTDRFKAGIQCRKEVLGDSYVNNAFAGIDNPMTKAHQQVITEAWAVWARPGLSRKQRSLLNIGILMTMNRSAELRAHLRGAVRNGLTELEIQEAIVHAGVYAGVPCTVEASKVAAAVLKEMKESGEYDEAMKKSEQSEQ